jgi:hypothetical protein
MIKYKIYFVSLLCLVFLGCRKNESASGGKAQINGYVELTGTVNGVYLYNKRISAGTTVFIKYGATSFPGTDISQYDSQQNVGANGTFDFSLMFEGNYYLYVTGYYVDGYGYTYPVSGGIQVNINTRKANLNYDIAVVPI